MAGEGGETTAMSNASPPLDLAVVAMLEILEDYLPSPIAGLPEPSVSLSTLTERPVGLGARRGSESRGVFGLAERKGVQLDAIVRYRLWAGDIAAAQTAALDMNGRLLGDRDTLWAAGVLRLGLDGMPPPEEVGSDSWSVLALYRVLYEYRYQDTDGSESIIARIPVDIDLEERDSPSRETTTVTDELVRWDDVAAPPLVLRGRGGFRGISSLSFIAGPVPPSGGVTITRTFDGAVGPPVAFASLAAFLDGVAGTDAPERHAETSFGSLTDFLAALGAPGTPAALGDWDINGVPDGYEPRSLDLEPRIELKDVRDRLEIAYTGTGFDHIAVVYVQAIRK